MELYLVRHGETNANRNHTTQGQLDTELSDLGLKQVDLVGGRLADVKFDIVLSSGEEAKMC